MIAANFFFDSTDSMSRRSEVMTGPEVDLSTIKPQISGTDSTRVPPHFRGPCVYSRGPKIPFDSFSPLQPSLPSIADDQLMVTMS